MTGSDVARPAASEPRLPDTIDALVVPLDGSGFSLPARPAATRPAVMLGAEVHLLSAVESVDQVDARDRELAGIEVLGHTRSWAGVRRLVLRTVAATILRHSRSPVLVVPRPDGATRHER
jgi:nucleotide-binding universal stress UspA family protein